MNYDIFEKNIIRKETNYPYPIYTIDCVYGNWGVSAPTKEEAEREAKHYFIQYYEDGEYNE